MIYVVVGEEYDYDISNHESIYASLSKDKAEAKLAFYVERHVRVKEAYEEYTFWMRESNPWQKFKPISCEHLYGLGKDMYKNEKFIAIQKENDSIRNAMSAEIDKKILELSIKYNVGIDFPYKSNYSYAIEEVESDDDN